MITNLFQHGKTIFGDCLEMVRTLSDESVDSVITSPPYWQLRDYGFAGQWGAEKNFDEYLDKMIELMFELKRVLKPTGTMWINLGDTYATFRGKNGQSPDMKERNRGIVKNQKSKHHLDRPNRMNIEKSLLLIPHRFAIRCIDELGLRLRNDIIWAKPHGLPESVQDRFTKKHEYVFFFVKEPKYYFDLDSIREPLKLESIQRLSQNIAQQQGSSRGHGGMKKNGNLKACAHERGKNPGDVSDFWAINPIQKKDNTNHFAKYNIELIRKPILAGSPVDGVILDPFAGTGTTAIAAIKYDRRFIAIEASEEYYSLMNSNIEAIDSQLKIPFPEVSNSQDYNSFHSAVGG